MQLRHCIFSIIVFVFVGVAIGQEPYVPPQPKLITAPQPTYPKIARDAGLGGRVTVKVVVDAQGAIVSVGDATGPAHICTAAATDPRVEALRNAVIESIKEAKFEPAMKDGVPVKSVAFISSTFDPTKTSPSPDPPGERRIITVDQVAPNALQMPKPEISKPARAARAAGAVSVRVVIYETGDVFTAEAVSGHPLLRTAAVRAACEAKFKPFLVEGKPVRVAGLITYIFSSL